MNECGHLTVGIDREIFGLEMIAIRQPQEMAPVAEPLFLEREPHFHRGLRETGSEPLARRTEKWTRFSVATDAPASWMEHRIIPML